MTEQQLAAMEQALEALIASDDFLFNYHYCEPNNEREMDSYSLIRINNLASVTALRTIIEQAKRQQALDKMAENERELGIQMQPEPVDFFDWYDNAIWGNEDFKTGCQRAWNAALEYAAQPAPVQEPFEYWNAVEGWVKVDELRQHFDLVGCGTIYKNAGEDRVPLYTAAQRQWAGLTDEEVAVLMMEAWGCASIAPRNAPNFARAIEAKLREKNGGAA